MTAASSLHSVAAMSSARRTDDHTAPLAQSSVDGALFARPALSWFGKNTHPVKTLVPVEVKEDFVRRAREAGYSGEGDCLRELVIAFTYGVEFLQKIHADRVASLSAIGTVTQP